jgi:hypothetical protein
MAIRCVDEFISHRIVNSPAHASSGERSATCFPNCHQRFLRRGRSPVDWHGPMIFRRVRDLERVMTRLHLFVAANGCELHSIVWCCLSAAAVAGPASQAQSALPRPHWYGCCCARSPAREGLGLLKSGVGSVAPLLRAPGTGEIPSAPGPGSRVRQAGLSIFGILKPAA